MSAIDPPQNVGQPLSPSQAFAPLILLAVALCAPATAQAQTRDPGRPQSLARVPAVPWIAAVAEASARFALPERWLRAVIHVESGGNPLARSGKGAMGLMQLMPVTWEALSMQLGLGSDPFDPRANVLAGAAFLRAMIDRYGDLPSALAAYNAGPGRVDDWRRTGHALPFETQAYVARLSLQLRLDASPFPSVPLPAPQLVSRKPASALAAFKPADWRSSGLFGARLTPILPGSGTAPGTAGRNLITAPGRPLSPGLFLALSQRGEP